MNYPLPDDAIEYIKILQVRPGDTLVLKTKVQLTAQQHHHTLEQMRRCTPRGVNCAILGPDHDLEVVRPVEHDDPPGLR